MKPYNKIVIIKLFFTLLFSSLLFSNNVNAKKVEGNELKKVALNYFSEQSGIPLSKLTISKSMSFKDVEEPCFTIFNFKPQGYIIVSNYDEVEPVLGYGLSCNFDFEDVPPALLELLTGYQKEIEFHKKKKSAQHKDIKEKWEKYKSDHFSSTLKSGYTVGDYLINTKWDQRFPYNDSIMVDPDATYMHCLVGCTGLALGQVLNYWGCSVITDGEKDSYRNWPHNGTAHDGLMIPGIKFYNRLYNWEIIKSASHPDKMESINQLLRDCAVAIGSAFATPTSIVGKYGTYGALSDCRYALENYFGMQTSGVISRDIFTGQLYVWDAMLISEISQGHPVIYSGSGSGGDSHTFIVDGVDNQYKFHCNWGWGGDKDEFYHLSDLTPGSHNFSSEQKAILGIQPYLDNCDYINGDELVCSGSSSYSITIPPSCSVQWAVSDDLNIVSGGNTTNVTVEGPGGGTLTANIYNSAGVLALSKEKDIWFGAPEATNVHLVQDVLTPGYDEVVLTYDNHMYSGVTNWMFPYGVQIVQPNTTWCTVNVTPSFQYGSMNVVITNACGTATANWMLYSLNGIYNYNVVMSPNPTSGITTLALEAETESKEVVLDFDVEWDVEIYSPEQDIKIKKAKIKDKKVTFDTKTWKKGIYIVRAKCKDQVITSKLLVE